MVFKMTNCTFSGNGGDGIRLSGDGGKVTAHCASCNHVETYEDVKVVSGDPVCPKCGGKSVSVSVSS